MKSLGRYKKKFPCGFIAAGNFFCTLSPRLVERVENCRFERYLIDVADKGVPSFGDQLRAVVEHGRHADADIETGPKWRRTCTLTYELTVVSSWAIL